MKYLLFVVGLLLTIACTTQNILPRKSLARQLERNNGKTTITAFLNEQKWDTLFPNRYGKGLNTVQTKALDFYSYQAFIQAAKLFPKFIAVGDEMLRKRELAAFLANIAQETSAGWADAPMGYFKWGLYYIKENDRGQNLDYADTSKKLYMPVTGQQYYGRGPKQISWNYNYGQFSEAWFGSKDSLLQHPDRILDNAVIAFASAIWFWMTPQFPKPSCHEVMTDLWTPDKNDIAKGRTAGFGATVNIINGGLECGSGTDIERTVWRYKYYTYFCHYFNVSSGENIGCKNQTPFGR